MPLLMGACARGDGGGREVAFTEWKLVERVGCSCESLMSYDGM